jgi:DNA repair exonuclease SbcCD nuclease subunit
LIKKSSDEPDFIRYKFEKFKRLQINEKSIADLNNEIKKSKADALVRSKSEQRLTKAVDGS